MRKLLFGFDAALGLSAISNNLNKLARENKALQKKT